MKKVIALILAVFLAQTITLAQKQWNKLAGMPPGGLIADMASDDLGTVYALTSIHSEVYYTTDNGLSWTLMPNTSDLWVANDIEVDKSTGTLFLGSFWFGIQWTTDEGLHWHEQRFDPIPGGFYANITNVCHKRGTNIVVGHEFAGPTGTMHTSLNGGATWLPKVIVPFIGTDMEFLADGTLLSGSSTGIFRSANNGVSWSATPVLPTFNIASIIQKGANGHVFAAANFNISTADTTGCGVFLSTDNGLSWTNISASLPRKDIVSLTFDSVHNKLYAMTNDGVYESPNEGVSWTLVSTGLATPEVTSITANNAGVFLGTARSGVAFSSTPSSGWTHRNSGLCMSTLGNIAVSANSHELHSIDLHATGVYQFNSSGWTHQFTGLPKDRWGLQIVNDSNGILYAAYNTPNDGIFRSLDHGTTWTNISAGIPTISVNPSMEYHPFVDAHNNIYVIAEISGLSEVYRSADSGNTWTTFLPIGPTNYVDLDFCHHSNDIYVTCMSTFPFVLVSHDNGISFDTLAFNFGVPYNGQLVIAQNDSLYLQMNDHIFKRHGINNWVSLPDGAWSHDYTWYPLTLYIDKESHLFASSDKHGVFYCDNDSTWTNISTGLPVFSYIYETDPVTLTPFDIGFDVDNTPIAICKNRYGGTLQGIYQFTLPTSLKNEQFATATVSLYPNPCRDVINISLHDQNPNPAIVQVYNTAGQLMHTQTIAGQNSSLNVSTLIPGVYFVRIHGNGRNQSLRFIRE
jgi:hypothetical protein